MPSKRVVIANSLSTLAILKSPGTAIAVSCFAVYYMTYSCLQASLSTVFISTYGVSGFIAGLCYIPFGVACAIGAFFTGMRPFQNVLAQIKLLMNCQVRSWIMIISGLPKKMASS